MKKKHFDRIRKAIEDFLGDVGSTEGHDQYVYEALAEDMTKAAELVYDSCMRGQDFANREG